MSCLCPETNWFDGKGHDPGCPLYNPEPRDTEQRSKAHMSGEVQTHPVQARDGYGNRRDARIPQVVTLLAYEVYSEIYSPQEALITGNCRGGFGVGELIAFLYARSFPKNEWNKRVDEAFNGMKNL